ncbi:MAG: TolC family protein [Gracilibacteraceae bacterium]|jgi:hypothetical protein|nr:TolC family protein [Gracilibacteraceae bacterium]
MKKLCFVSSLIICVLLLSGSIAISADALDDGLLTLEEAKALALKNDINYRYQDKYIQDAKDNYKKLSEDTSINSRRGSNIAQKESARISSKIQLENAYSNIRKAVLTKADLKRSSDNDTVNSFYGVIEAENSLANALTDLELKRQELKKAEFKYKLNIISKNSLTQAEESYRNSEAAYNKAAMELESCILKLGKSICQELDISRVKLDTTLSIPDIKSIDLEKIKEDNLENNLSYFSAREQYKLAEYELALTEEKYEDYYDELKKGSSNVREEFENMLFNAQKKFEDAEYSYNEKLKDLEESLKEQYKILEDLYESYMEQKEDINDMKLTVKENKIKYTMGIITKAALDSSIANLEKLERQMVSTIIKLNKQYMSLVQYSQL